MSDGIELTDEEYDTFMAVLAEQRCQHSHADTVCPPPPERAILTDLIKELRGQADIWQEGDINEDRWDYPAMMLRAHADRAEARLREVGGDE